MVFGATDKTSPRRESFPAGAPPGPRRPGPYTAAALPEHTGGPAAAGPCPRAQAAPGGTTRPPLLPGCHSGRDDGPEPQQRSLVDTEIALALARLGDSTDRVLATADALTDAQAAPACQLPGWTRRHGPTQHTR